MKESMADSITWVFMQATEAKLESGIVHMYLLVCKNLYVYTETGLVAKCIEMKSILYTCIK